MWKWTCVCVKWYKYGYAEATWKNVHRRSTLLLDAHGEHPSCFPCSSYFSVIKFPISQQVLTELDARHRAKHILFILLKNYFIYLIPTTQDTEVQRGFCDQPKETQLVLGGRWAGNPKPVPSAMASLGCPPHTGSQGLRRGWQNLTKSKNPIQRPKSRLSDSRKIETPELALFGLQQTCLSLIGGAEHDSGPLVNINKRKMVWFHKWVQIS